ncbi:MAG: HDOD domain-containing protein [Verrucomicrobia bacterium]|nr:HDOD domain-containing protein [Verrucomicrobiota bacterium]
MSVSGCARQIMKSKGGNRKMVDESMVAGLLHDAGKLVLATNDPHKSMEVVRLCKEKEISLMKAENAVFGFNHGDVGGVLFRLWGLPQKVVEAIKFHHVPQRSQVKGLSVLAALHLAEMISQPTGGDGRGLRNQEDMD